MAPVSGGSLALHAAASAAEAVKEHDGFRRSRRCMLGSDLRLPDDGQVRPDVGLGVAPRHHLPVHLPICRGNRQRQGPSADVWVIISHGNKAWRRRRQRRRRSITLTRSDSKSRRLSILWSLPDPTEYSSPSPILRAAVH